jgi:hypothetical protein
VTIPLPNAPRFADLFAAISPRLFAVLRHPGERWIVDAATGQVVDRSPTQSTAWSVPPSGRDGPALTVCADGPGGVVAFTPETGHRQWASEAMRSSGWSGAAPQVAIGLQGVVVVNNRNDGAEILHLHAENGQFTRTPFRLLGSDADLSHARETDQGLTIPIRGPEGNQLLHLGQRRWLTPLPAGEAWQVTFAAGGFWLAPRAPLPEDDPWSMARRAWERTPFLAFPPFPAWAGALVDAWTERPTMVLGIDPESGRTDQRFAILAGPRLDLQAIPQGLVAVTVGRVYWWK